MSIESRELLLGGFDNHLYDSTGVVLGQDALRRMHEFVRRRELLAQIAVLEQLQRSMRRQPSNYSNAESVWCFAKIAALQRDLA